jgi:hypothetical protein
VAPFEGSQGRAEYAEVGPRQGKGGRAGKEEDRNLREAQEDQEMSVHEKIEVTCPSCKAVQLFTIWNSINATESPPLKTRLLNGDLTMFRCEACGESTHIDYPLLYHDMSRHLMIWLVPLDAADKDVNSCIERYLGAIPMHRCRLVRSRNALIEKILIFDEEVDDRVMEFYKMIVQEALQERGEFKGTLFFEGRNKESKEKEMVFTCISGKEALSWSAPWTEFLSVADDIAAMLPDENKELGKWLTVDPSYLQELESSYKPS